MCRRGALLTQAAPTCSPSQVRSSRKFAGSLRSVPAMRLTSPSTVGVPQDRRGSAAATYARTRPFPAVAYDGDVDHVVRITRERSGPHPPAQAQEGVAGESYRGLRLQRSVGRSRMEEARKPRGRCMVVPASRWPRGGGAFRPYKEGSFWTARLMPQLMPPDSDTAESPYW